ncbi:post-GPI attachment to proteins factor [Nesidiocoris tenuis]|uniref:Post-GPI attachment to proteins factor 3 n=1 Tax=Nesidiocoris tenuis TaxID=355587 RepID=A0ABN7AY37_9HEMI|nr:post-GPI attachment to proteins factor [Nesidiocoris tenuis]
MIAVLFTSFVLAIFCHPAQASLGNSFPSYKICVEECRKTICDAEGYYFLQKDLTSLPLLLLWRCSDDCQYRCMWIVVDEFERKNWPAPQFHGKWPFVRILGIQEPASTLFSIINLSIHYSMFRKYLGEFNWHTPLIGVWSVHALVSMNGWIWSTIFHTRDIDFTELMDYLSAFAMVFSSVYCLGMRLLVDMNMDAYGGFLTAICILFYLNHALYLSSGPFDYSYNLVANISVGFITLLICGVLFYRNKSVPHFKYLGGAVIILTASLYLEVNDFPPIFRFLDAHALWHALTAPSIYLFWRYIHEDSRYLKKRIPIRW